MLKRNKLTFEGHFTQIPNAWLRDQRLSYKARGILAILMSHEIGWRTSVNQLCGENDSRDAIKSGIRELEKYGYLIREQKQNAVSGKFEPGVWILSNPHDDEPLTEKPLTDNPPTANHTTKNTNSKKTNTKNLFSEDWSLSDEQREKLQTLYPSANLDQHLQEMILYIIERGEQAKVKSMPAKFSRWMINADKYAKGALSQPAPERKWEWG